MPAAPDRFARAFQAGARRSVLWFAGSTLALSWLAVSLLLVHSNGLVGVLIPGGGIALVALGGFLIATDMPGHMRVWKGLTAIAIMECGLAVYLMTVHLDPKLPHSTAQFSISFVKLAIVVYTVNAGRRWGSAFAAVVAVVVSEVLCATVGPALGYPLGIDGPELAGLLLVLGGSACFALTRRSTARARSAFSEVQRQDALRRTREIAVSRAAAVVHDTVLNDLAVLATTEAGPLGDKLSARLSSTLELLASPDWAQAPAALGQLAGGAVQAAVDRARAEGLEVTVVGDTGALGGLEPGVEQALGRAIEQCLSNTLRHANVDEAEVTVLVDDLEVSIMVTDEGEGFDVEAVDEDRLGISGSVRSRIEDAAGRVRIFARPGLGTSVLLTVPRRAMATA